MGTYSALVPSLSTLSSPSAQQSHITINKHKGLLENHNFQFSMNISDLLNQTPDPIQITLPSIEKLYPVLQWERYCNSPRAMPRSQAPLSRTQPKNDPVSARAIEQFNNTMLRWATPATPKPRFNYALHFRRCYKRADPKRTEMLSPKDEEYIESLIYKGTDPALNETERSSAVYQPPTNHRQSPAAGPSDLNTLENAAESLEAKHPGEDLWKKEAAKLAAEKQEDDDLDAASENLKNHRIACTKKAKNTAKKTSSGGPSLPTVAGPSRSGPPPGLPTNNLPSNFPWATNYVEGNLHKLGLKAGVWGPEIDAPSHPGKMPRTGKGHTSDGPKRRPFDLNWGLYTILARIPGGEATLDVLYKYCLEWCNIIGKRESCRRTLSYDDEFFTFNSKDIISGKKISLWRITDVGEIQIKNPGPKRKIEDGNDLNQRKRQKGSKRPTPSSKSGTSQSSTSETSSSSPQSSPAETITPPSVYTPSSPPMDPSVSTMPDFTPINRPSPVACGRTALSSSPAKKQR